MQTLEPVLAPPRTFTLPKAPDDDSAAARQLARALHETADTVTAAQQQAHQVLERARQEWAGPAARASQHPLHDLDVRTRTVAHHLHQAADALEEYAHKLDQANEQHGWSWKRVAKVAAFVTVTTGVVVLTVGAAAPAAAAADAAFVAAEIAATAGAVAAATTAAAEATAAVTAAVRALQLLRAVATFLRPQIAITAGMADLQAIDQVRRTGDLDAGSLAHHAAVNVAFGAVGGKAAGAVGGWGAEVSSPLLAYLLPKTAQAAAWGGTTAAAELAIDGQVDPIAVATSAGVAFGGAVLADGLARWLPTSTHPAAPVSVERSVNYRSEIDSKWGLSDYHLNKHFYEHPKYALTFIDPGGDAQMWLSHMAELAQRTPTQVHPDGMLDIVGIFRRTNGSGSFSMGVRLFPKQDGSFDLVTMLTRQ